MGVGCSQRGAPGVQRVPWVCKRHARGTLCIQWKQWCPGGAKGEQQCCGRAEGSVGVQMGSCACGGSCGGGQPHGCACGALHIAALGEPLLPRVHVQMEPCMCKRSNVRASSALQTVPWASRRCLAWTCKCPSVTRHRAAAADGAAQMHSESTTSPHRQPHYLFPIPWTPLPPPPSPINKLLLHFSYAPKLRSAVAWPLATAVGLRCPHPKPSPPPFPSSLALGFPRTGGAVLNLGSACGLGSEGTAEQCDRCRANRGLGLVGPGGDTTKNPKITLPREWGICNKKAHRGEREGKENANVGTWPQTLHPPAALGPTAAPREWGTPLSPPGPHHRL